MPILRIQGGLFRLSLEVARRSDGVAYRGELRLHGLGGDRREVVVDGERHAAEVALDGMDAGEAIEDTADSVDAAVAVQVRYLENHAVRHYAGSIRGAGAPRVRVR